MRLFYFVVANLPIYCIVLVCEANGPAKENRPVKAFIELMARIMASLNDSYVITQVMDLATKAFDLGYAEGRPDYRPLERIAPRQDFGYQAGSLGGRVRTQGSEGLRRPAHPADSASGLLPRGGPLLTTKGPGTFVPGPFL